MRCLVCNNPKTDHCHVKSRGAGGSDDSWNIIYLCRKHHRLQHTMTWHKFCEMYPVVYLELQSKGWRIEEILGVKKLTRDTIR